MGIGVLRSRALPNASVSEKREERTSSVDPREERIRRRAYELWEQNGKPEGGEMAFWLQSEQEIDAPGEQGKVPLTPPDTLKGNVE
jgi:Protein of unknown function (DUF2934)